MGDHGNRSVALHHIRTEPESHTRRTASLCGSLSWFIYNFIGGLVGEKGKRYIPFLGTILIYLGCANISGFFRAKPPTKDLNVTAGLAIISLFLIIYSGIHEKGLKGYIHSYVEPMPMMAAINILELFTRPLSLCMRLFWKCLRSIRFDGIDHTYRTSDRAIAI